MLNGKIVPTFVIDIEAQHARLPLFTAPGIQVQSLARYEVNGVPAIFVLQQGNLSKGKNFIKQMDPASRRASVITARMPFGEIPPRNQPHATIIIPHCNDRKFQVWLNLLAGRNITHVYLDWFVPLKITTPYTYNQSLLIKTFDNIPFRNAPDIQRKHLQQAIHCSSFKLDYLSKQIYGMTPGKLLRIWRYFVLTNKFMAHESRIGEHSRRGKSPLRTIENDYCEALIRLLKVSYTELRIGARDQHWVAIWVAALRKTLHRYYA